MTLQELKLSWPTVNHSIAQPFSANANPLYKGQGLNGHPGLDIGALWGDPIYDCTNGKGYVYKIFHRGDPILMDYRAVCQLLELDDYVLEITYGHCNDVLYTGGYPSPGQQLATVGNTGDVFSGDHKVTEAEKDAGSHDGAHVHFQIRKCIKVNEAIDISKRYLNDLVGGVYKDDSGFMYEVVNYDNGEAGCIDPLPFLQDPQVPVSSDLTPEQAVIIQTEITTIQKLVMWIKSKYFSK